MIRRDFLRRAAMALAGTAGLPATGFAQTKRTMRLALTGDVILSRRVSMLEYDAERLASITLHPVTLGMTLPRHERGTPLTAAREEAERIKTELAATSLAYGTTVRWEGATGTGHVTLA